MEDPIRSYVVGLLLGALTVYVAWMLSHSTTDTAMRSMFILTCTVIVDMCGLFMCGKDDGK